MTAGRAYIVGEHRPEVFVPEQNGRIISSIQRAQAGSLAAPASAPTSGRVGALTITNWEDGTGYFELIADDRVHANNAMQQQTVRASR